MGDWRRPLIRILMTLMLSGLANAALADATVPTLRADLSPRCALEVDVRKDDQPGCWRIDCVDAVPRELGCDATALHQVVDVQIAPDQQWMAVTSVGEGHPMLELVALPEFLAGKPYRALCTINPYPGTVYFERWEAGKPRVISDVDLTVESVEARAEGIGDERHYLLDPADCALGQ